MIDRELLELAAKAAGIKRTIEWLGHHEYNPDWNPLTDDGDALRLAVKLHIEVLVDSFGARASFIPAGQHPMSEGTKDVYEDEQRDPYAATRRAIVRAAAELGRAKE